MLPSPCYIISDAHLGVTPPSVEQQLLAFLRAARADAGALVINGDLFDFWFEWKRVIPRTGYRTLAELAAFVETGKKVLWIAGNHDCWGEDFIRGDIGAEYVVGSWRGSIAGWSAWIDHGDGLRDLEDRRYRALRSVLRNRLAIRSFRALLHPDWATRLASGSSAASRTYRARDAGEGLKKVALRDLDADSSLELRVLGHSHVPALVRHSDNKVYANAGTWLGDSTYLRVVPGRIELFRWRDAGRQPELIAAEPRV